MPVIGTAGGNFFFRDYADSAWSQKTLPSGVAAVTTNRPKPVFERYRNRAYIAGYFDSCLVWTERWELLKNGITLPGTAPTLALGASSGGSSGINLGYATFVHKINGIVVAESNPVGPTAAVEASGQGFSWSAIPASGADSRTTHVALYRSVDGAIPRLAGEVTYGTTTLTENVETDSLGRELPVRIGADGQAEVDWNARGQVPYCKINTNYHRMMFYAGDPNHPERIYHSLIDEPEAVNVDEADGTFLVTLDGEPVIGMFRHGDELIIGCNNPPAFYAVQGYSETDLQIRKISNFYGLLSHHSQCYIGPNSDLWFADPMQGPCMYNGSFRWLFRDRAKVWTDYAKANPTLIEGCWAVQDRVRRAYKLFIPQSDDSSYYHVGFFEPTLSGEQPWWTTDIRTREDTFACEVQDDGQAWADLHTASSDGIVRKENVDTDASDDSDTYAKAVTIQHAHLFLPDQKGDDNHGRSIKAMDLYLKHENNTVTVSMYGGDDTAPDALAPQWTADVASPKETSPRRQKVAQTSEHIPVRGVSGKGITVKLHAHSPVGLDYRGFTLYHVPGRQEHPFTE